MSPERRAPCRLQRHPAVQLRLEHFGGLAFHRQTGDLLELDAEGFLVLRVLSEPRTPPGLTAALRRSGLVARWSELSAFLEGLEARGFVRRVGPEAFLLAPEAWAERPVPEGAGLSAPLVAHWAVTYRCNLRCAFCYSESGPGREAGPDPGVRRRLVERLAAWGVLEVALGGGEPTLLPDFAELLAAIRAEGMVPNVTTNGTLATPAVVRALAEHAGVVHLSADRPELLDAVRGEGVFERLRGTAEALRQSGVRLGVNLLLTPDNVGDLGRSLQTALDLGVSGVTLLRPKGAWAVRHWPGFPGRDDLAALAAGLRGFLAGRPPLRLFVDTALRGEWSRLGLLDDPEPEVLGCGGGQRHVAVTPEGDVYPCSHARRPELRMGNLLTDSAERLWQQGPGLVSRRRYEEACSGTACPCRETA